MVHVHLDVGDVDGVLASFLLAISAGQRDDARSAYRSAPPVTVKVFPLPVWPYAKTVPLRPSSAPRTGRAAHRSNTSSCFASGPRTPSKRNAYFSR